MPSLINRDIIFNYSLPKPERVFLNELIGYFNRLVPERLLGAKSALAENDLRRLRFLLNAVRNSFLNVGALVVAQECQELEDDLDSISEPEVHVRIEALQARFDEVQSEFTRILEEEF